MVLLLNPGFAHADYFAESRMPVFRRRLEATLRQDFTSTELPLLWLDPEFCWHGGFGWWERRLRSVAGEIARERFDGRYLDALRSLAGRIAQIELVPYHSPTFGAHSLIEQLPSVTMVRTCVREHLLPRARAGETTIIVLRGNARW